MAALSHLIKADALPGRRVGIAKVINHDMSRARALLSFSGTAAAYPNTRAAMRDVIKLLQGADEGVGYTPFHFITGEVL